MASTPAFRERSPELRPAAAETAEETMSSTIIDPRSLCHMKDRLNKGSEVHNGFHTRIPRTITRTTTCSS
ncbi:hypothetical protein KIN20_037542 [Parelaphostrongylus tenuis]|uniref:Uncharacterized protein n=1 Tax=Parelaphostrongylus tenuis TaxID=148309 RepID=A0AAD5REE8_PARTN|nr:hypothetical protein KIN20_037542 [Parelaphostrongylus tenuis]